MPPPEPAVKFAGGPQAPTMPPTLPSTPAQASAAAAKPANGPGPLTPLKLPDPPPPQAPAAAQPPVPGTDPLPQSRSLAPAARPRRVAPLRPGRGSNRFGSGGDFKMGPDDAVAASNTNVLPPSPAQPAKGAPAAPAGPAKGGPPAVPAAAPGSAPAPSSAWGGKLRNFPLPFHKYAELGNVDALGAYLDGGKEVDALSAEGCTALWIAAKYGQQAACSLLLERGASPAETGDDVDAIGGEPVIGLYPLHIACIGSHEAVVRVLLERDAAVDVRCADGRGATPLWLAASKGAEGICRLLLEKGANAEAANAEKCSPLRIAAEGGYEAVCRLLLEKGAKVDAADVNNWAPLHAAAFKGSVPVCRVLLASNANLVAVDVDDWTPLHAAAQKGHEPVCRLLLEKSAQLQVDAREGNQETALHFAADEGHAAVCGLLLDKGAKLDAGDKDGWTPLHNAANMGRVEVVRLLTTHARSKPLMPAVLRTKDKEGHTPLHFAAENGHKQVVGLLVDSTKGQDQDLLLTAADKDGYTALHYAALGHNEETMEFLLSRSRDPNALAKQIVHMGGGDWDGATPLHFAQSASVVRLLLKYKSPVDAVCTLHKIGGLTPLHTAFNPDVAGELLKAGGVLEKTDERQRTPLLAACAGGDAAVLGFLLERGARWDVQDAKGVSALEYALRWSQASTVEPFLKCERVQFAPDRVAAVCRRFVDDLGSECSVPDLVSKFPAAKLNAALYLAKLLKAASLTKPDQASLLLECHEDAKGVAIQLLDAMAVTFSERLHRRTVRKEEGADVDASWAAFMTEMTTWNTSSERNVRRWHAKCRELTRNDPLDTWLADQLLERVSDRYVDQEEVDEFCEEAVNEKRPINDCVDVLERRWPGTGSAIDLALKLDHYEFLGHPFVRRYIYHMAAKSPPLNAETVLPALGRAVRFMGTYLECGPDKGALEEAKAGPPKKEAAAKAGEGKPRRRRAEKKRDPSEGVDPDSGPLWWETRDHFLNSWRGKFAADFGAYIALLALMILVIATWRGDGESPRAHVHVPLLLLLIIQSSALLRFERTECGERGSADYFGDFFNRVDLTVLTVTIGLSVIALIGEVNPRVRLLGGHAIPILSALFIPASFRILEFGYVNPIVGPMLVCFARMVRNVASVAIIIFIVFCSFTFSMWGWAATFTGEKASEEPISFPSSMYVLYKAILGENDYDTVEENVSPVGAAFLSIYQIIVTILLINVITGLFSFTFAAILEDSRNVYAFGRAKVILRYTRTGQRLIPPLNLVWWAFGWSPTLRATAVNVVAFGVVLPPLVVALACASAWRLLRRLWLSDAEVRQDEEEEKWQTVWNEAIDRHRRIRHWARRVEQEAAARRHAHAKGKEAPRGEEAEGLTLEALEAEAEARQGRAKLQLRGSLAWEAKKEQPDAVPAGELAVQYTKETLPKNVGLLAGSLKQISEQLEKIASALPPPAPAPAARA